VASFLSAFALRRIRGHAANAVSRLIELFEPTEKSLRFASS
jgi:hypothetical protein